LKKIVFIINKKSGVNRRKNLINTIEKNLNTQLFSYSIVYTNFPKHGIELANEAAKNGAHAVVAVGGDGSINDVAAGLLGTNTALGLIPMGSGNGFARSMGISLKVHKAIQVLNDFKIQNIDVGFANKKLFVSNAGVGFPALIVKMFAQKKIRGFYQYAKLALYKFWRYKNATYNVVVDGIQKQAEKAFFVSVSNAPQFGYGFTVAPGALVNDGKLDLVILKTFPLYILPILLIRFFIAKIDDSKYFVRYSCSTCSISNRVIDVFQTDGDDYPCKQNFECSIKPNALNVILP
jgi:YegS/Rv2252/BmrU family lipid kinase